MVTEKTRAHLALLFASVLSGVNYSFSKSIMPDYMTPAAFTLFRIGCAAVLFIITALLFKREGIQKRDIPRFLLLALVGMALNQSLYLNGLRYTSPVDASIITTGIPLIVLIISAISLREKITLKKMAGIVVGGIGALMIVIYGGFSGIGQGQLGGNLLVLGSCVCYACYMLWVRALTQKYSPVTVMMYMYTLSALMLLPFNGKALFNTDFSNITPAVWGAFASVIIGSSFLAFFCTAYGLKRVKASTSAIYQYLQPIVASVFAIFRGQDTWSVVKILAALLVIAGVVIATRSDKPILGRKNKSAEQ